jgi:uncharacterized protein (TIRG00374 family)
MIKKRFFFMKVALGIVLLVLLYYKVGFSKILKVIGNINPLYILPALAITCATYYVATVNIQLFTKTLHCRISFGKLLKYCLVSWSLGLLAPGKLGEFSLAFFLRKEKMTLGEGFAIALLDKLITAFTLAVISVVGLIWVFSLPSTALVVIMATLVMVALVMTARIERVRRFVRTRILRRYEKDFRGFSKTLFYLMKNRATWYNTILTTLKWALSATAIWYFFLAMNLNVGVATIFFINSIATVVSLIPVTMNGLGIREGTAIYLYSLVKVDPAVAASVYVLATAINYLVGALTLFLIRIDGTRGMQV